MLEIEKGIPMPERRPGKPRKYPFREMETGDSFFVPAKHIKAMSASITGAQRRIGFKFSARTETDGVRVWRTA